MIVIIDYGMGNLGSVYNMFKKIGVGVIVSSSVTDIKRAKKIVLSGVGAFDNGMKNLIERGLVPILNVKVLREKTPILGLCLGMQLFTQSSEEGQIPGLGWLDAETIRFKFDQTSSHMKVPHMGWNTLRVQRPHPLFADMEADIRFYFVHSYHLACAESGMVLAQTYYGYEFVSAVAKDNIVGVQFHPEKSHKFGMQLLRNFAERI